MEGKTCRSFQRSLLQKRTWVLTIITKDRSAYPNLSGVIWRAGFSPPNLVGKFRPFED